MTVVALPPQSEIQRCDRQIWQEVQSEKISRHKIHKEPAHERERHRRLVVKDQCRKDDDDQPQIRLMQPRKKEWNHRGLRKKNEEAQKSQCIAAHSFSPA